MGSDEDEDSAARSETTNDPPSALKDVSPSRFVSSLSVMDLILKSEFVMVVGTCCC